MWSPDVAEKIWRSVGGLERIQAAEVLFSFVRQYEERPDQAWVFLESQEASRERMRDMWGSEDAGRASYQWEQDGQQAGEYSDDVCSLPCALPSWEFGIPRVAIGIKHRVDRLKCLGNAVVPQVAEYVGRCIIEYDKERGIS
jgi:hypothetical protein